MVDFIIKLNPQFTDADKEACLPVIDKIVEFATIARSKGLLALELSANQAESIFLRTALNLIVDANDPDKVREMLEHFILADNHSGAELLSRLIILEGVMRIAAGSNPRLIEEGLNMMLGEKYLERMFAAREEKEKETKPVHDFMRSFETHWQEREKQENKFRDRHFFLCEFLKIKDIKSDVDNFIDDFNTTEILDFYFYILGDDRYSIKLIVDKVKYTDLVTIFKSGACGGVTYVPLT
jgi:chemotaxis protein MotA